MQMNDTPSNFINRQEKVDIYTLVVGAGPAGLAVGACLKQAGISYLILEQTDRVGSAWRRHYDRLHLHTDKAHSELPFIHFPKNYPRYLSRTQLIAYLEAYARQFELEVRFGQQVLSARFNWDDWEVQTQDSLYKARNLVIAAGYNRVPYVPSWPGQGSFRGPLLHSSQYRNGEPFREQKVLVVGFGNSGGEIAIDLWEHGAQPSLSVRGPVNVIPREVFGIPVLSIGILQRKLPLRLVDVLNAPILRITVGDLRCYGLSKLPHGPASQISRDSRIPLIDIGTIQLIKDKQIRVCPGIDRFTEEDVIFSDATRGKFDAVILETGFRPEVNAFLENASAVCDENGRPFSSGSEAGISGLYFCGYYVSPTGMLREIAIEAQKISAAISRKFASGK
jgi:hypothetical protein